MSSFFYLQCNNDPLEYRRNESDFSVKSATYEKRLKNAFSQKFWLSATNYYYSVVARFLSFKLQDARTLKELKSYTYISV